MQVQEAGALAGRNFQPWLAKSHLTRCGTVCADLQTCLAWLLIILTLQLQMFGQGNQFWNSSFPASVLVLFDVMM